MSMLLYLMPVALFLGATGLLAFLWAFGSGQYDDLDGAAERILLDAEQPDDRGGAVAIRSLGTARAVSAG